MQKREIVLCIYLKGVWSKVSVDVFSQVARDRLKEMASSCTLGLDMRNNSFPRRVEKAWNRLLRAVVESSCLDVLKPQGCNAEGRDLAVGRLMVGLDDLESVSQPKQF